MTSIFGKNSDNLNNLVWQQVLVCMFFFSAESPLKKYIKLSSQQVNMWTCAKKAFCACTLLIIILQIDRKIQMDCKWAAIYYRNSRLFAIRTLWRWTKNDVSVLSSAFLNGLKRTEQHVLYTKNNSNRIGICVNIIWNHLYSQIKTRKKKATRYV